MASSGVEWTRVIRKPQLRFERVYKGALTVLEGAELIAAFFARLWSPEPADPHDPGDRLLLSVGRAYIDVHGKPVVRRAFALEARGRGHTDADARKLDLFYRGMKECWRELAIRPESRPRNHRRSTARHTARRPRPTGRR